MAHFNPEQYERAHDMMNVMVANSQWPGGENSDFVERVGSHVESLGLRVDSLADPEHPGKALLMVEVGAPDGEQALATISHSDVVGVEGQKWDTDPTKLHIEGDTWIGRGVCDTHGSGVSMILAALQPGMHEELVRADKKINIIFTYDEEATSPELSMRGARLAAGLMGPASVVTGKYFIAGEPTEIDGSFVPMRSHKGRFLGHIDVHVEHSGHVSDNVQNALAVGARIVGKVADYAATLRYGSGNDPEAQIYNPPHTTVQVSAATVKSGDYSATPSDARFTFDMRTLPDVHELRARELSDLVVSTKTDEGETVKLEIVKDAPGSITNSDSPIVKLAEEVTGSVAQGFNGGDEGRILRLLGGKDGVTLGPGELRFAHMPNEQIQVVSIFNAADVYARIFRQVVKLQTTNGAS